MTVRPVFQIERKECDIRVSIGRLLAIFLVKWLAHMLHSQMVSTSASLCEIYDRWFLVKKSLPSLFFLKHIYILVQLASK